MNEKFGNVDAWCDALVRGEMPTMKGAKGVKTSKPNLNYNTARGEVQVAE